MGRGQGSEGAPETRRHWRIRAGATAAVVVAVVAVVVLVGLRPRGGPHGAGPLVPVGSQAPSFSVPRLAGRNPVNLDAIGRDAHHPVVLNFFASWCFPCQKETPLLAAAAREEAARGGSVRFVGIDVNDPPTAATAFVARAGVTYPVGVDPTLRVSSGLYGLNGLPQTFYLGANGTVIGHTIGAVDSKELDGWLRRLGSPTGT